MTPATALVLCGGLGTRLRTAIGPTQKVMAEVGGKPFLERVVALTASSGVYALATDLPVWDVGTPERLDRCRPATVRGGS